MSVKITTAQELAFIVRLARIRILELQRLRNTVTADKIKALRRIHQIMGTQR